MLGEKEIKRDARLHTKKIQRNQLIKDERGYQSGKVSRIVSYSIITLLPILKAR